MALRSATDEWADLHKALGVELTAGDLEVVSPIDGTTLGAVPERVKEDSQALQLWAGLGAIKRQRALALFAAMLQSHRVHLAHALCLESGVPIRQCEHTLSAGIAHLETVAATLRLPAEVHNSARWVPIGQAVVGHSEQHSLGDDFAALASALYCGCTVIWEAPTGRQLLAHLILHLWHLAQASNDAAAPALSVRASSQPVTERQPNRVWIAASAPVEHAIEAISNGVHWHNGNGIDSAHHVLVDHSLHREMEQRLADALQHTVRTDPRDPACQRAPIGPVPTIRSIDEHSAPPQPDDIWPDLVLQPISDLPPAQTALNSTSLFSCDQRDIDQVLGADGDSSTRVCINTVPSSGATLSPSAWWPWLRPQHLSVEVDTP